MLKQARIQDIILSTNSVTNCVMNQFVKFVDVNYSSLERSHLSLLKEYEKSFVTTDHLVRHGFDVKIDLGTDLAITDFVRQ